MTLGGAYGLHRVTAAPLVVCIVGLFVAGEAAHWYFCVDTATQPLALAAGRLRLKISSWAP